MAELFTYGFTPHYKGFYKFTEEAIISADEKKPTTEPLCSESYP